jgi:hypothetical protein
VAKGVSLNDVQDVLDAQTDAANRAYAQRNFKRRSPTPRNTMRASSLT